MEPREKNKRTAGSFRRNKRNYKRHRPVEGMIPAGRGRNEHFPGREIEGPLNLLGFFGYIQEKA